MDISKWFDTFVDIEPSTYCSTEVMQGGSNEQGCTYAFVIATINSKHTSILYDNIKLAEYYAQECLKKIREDE